VCEHENLRKEWRN